MPELEIKGLAVRLTVCIADVGKAGVYVNITPWSDQAQGGVRQRNRHVNDTALPTWGNKILSHRRISPDGLSCQLLPSGEAWTGGGNHRLESAAFHRMTGETARVSTRKVTEERFLQEWWPFKYPEFEWPLYSKTVPTQATPSPPILGGVRTIFSNFMGGIYKFQQF